MINVVLGAPLRNFISPSTEYSKSIIEFPASPAMPTTYAGRFLCRRHLIDPRIADLLAGLAGLGIEEARQ
jgi:hypothetical protein